MYIERSDRASRLRPILKSKDLCMTSDIDIVWTSKKMYLGPPNYTIPRCWTSYCPYGSLAFHQAKNIIRPIGPGHHISPYGSLAFHQAKNIIID